MSVPSCQGLAIWSTFQTVQYIIRSCKFLVMFYIHFLLQSSFQLLLWYLFSCCTPTAAFSNQFLSSHAITVIHCCKIQCFQKCGAALLHYVLPLLHESIIYSTTIFIAPLHILTLTMMVPSFFTNTDQTAHVALFSYFMANIINSHLKMTEKHNST